jgi:hypothetical protein
MNKSRKKLIPILCCITIVATFLIILVPETVLYATGGAPAVPVKNTDTTNTTEQTEKMIVKKIRSSD